MGLGSTRPNTADDKMIAAIERGNQPEFVDSKPPKIKDDKLAKEKEQQKQKSLDKMRALKALRLAAEQEAKAK